MKGLEVLQPAQDHLGSLLAPLLPPGDARLQKQPWGWAPLLGELLEMG